MKKEILFLALCFCSNIFLVGQNTEFEIGGIIRNAETFQVLSDVNISVREFGQGTVSDLKGGFKLKISSAPVTVVLSHIGYKNYYLKVNSTEQSQFEIFMQPKVTHLREFEIGAKRVRNLIKSTSLHLLDYEHFEDNLLLIAYEDQQFTKGRMILMDYYGDTLTYANIDSPEKLYKDCFDNVHVYIGDTVFQVYYDGNKLKLLFPTHKTMFANIMEECVEELDNKVYFRHYYLKYQLINYLYYDHFDSSYHPLTQAVNETLMRTVKNWGRYVASYRNFGGYNEMDERFDDLVMFKPLYAPLVKVGDSLHFFNFTDGQLDVYSKDAIFRRSEPLTFHHGKNWKPELFVDEANGDVFTLFLSGGISYLQQINTQNGQIMDSYQIPDLPYVEKISIHNGWAYFLYIERHNVFHDFHRFKHLYKMRLETQDLSSSR
jgi:CarboxypepD_reg-like domain